MEKQDCWIAKGNWFDQAKKQKVTYSILNLVSARALLLKLKKVGYGIKDCVM